MTGREPRYEYRIQYRRSWWAYRQSRIFQRHQFAETFLRKLMRTDGGYAPLVELTIERRRVPEWTDAVDLMAGEEWTP